MKADISYEISLTSNKYYLVINDKFYITISKKTFFELAEFLAIKGVKNERKRND